MKFWDCLASFWQPGLHLLDRVIERVGVGTMIVVTFLTSIIPGINTMDPIVLNQAGATLAYGPWHAVTIPLRRRTSPEVEAAKAKAGGFMRGICHSFDDYARLPEANIEWGRLDVPFPYKADGVTLTKDYQKFRQELIDRKKAGLKSMIVTPNPNAFVEHGIDPRTPSGEAKVAAAAKFIVQDLKPYIGAVQIANELGIPRFCRPLNTEECARFLAVQLEAVDPIKGDVLVGFNSGGPQMDLHSLMKPYLKYCDYIGFDIYIGCFFGVATWMWLFDLGAELMWSYTGKSIVFTEFGYIGGGAPKSTREKNALLQERYNFPDEAAVRADPEDFLAAVERTNPNMAAYIRQQCGDDLEGFLFSLDFRTHLYAEIPADYVIKEYPHTPEGQAGFYSDVIPRLAKHPFVIGAFIYEWKDAERCYVCHQEDCPTETRLGLVDSHGKPKPAFDAVKDAYGALR